jgi:chromosome segregation protein
LHFSRLRLSGFKSFVDPTDFRIEAGLTGIVGPNGCGKSNILEALRWVMGANSAKALRGDGMDDVIFSGSVDRPARNHAEVTLTIDNTDRDAPAEFNLAPVLEIVRRIDRGEGSQFRINGREVRARDVQLVFADASTGANSPALVRQGQITELIAARPRNRRRILEEAAGVSGLHSRRHEVELRVRAADANLTRLDDVMREVETNLIRLRREARHAERYRRLAAEIRLLQSVLLYARWSEAAASFEILEAESAGADERVRSSASQAGSAMAAAIEAEALIRPRREEETAASALLHRLSIDKDRIDRALEDAAEETCRLTAEMARIDTDLAREGQIVEDAGRALARLEAETSHLEGEAARMPERLPGLQAASEQAEAARGKAEAVVEALASEIAAAEAQARGVEARVEHARLLLARTLRALTQARSERQAIGPLSDPARSTALEALAGATDWLRETRKVLDIAEESLAVRVREEGEARDKARAAEDSLGRLVAEARGLASAAASPATAQYTPALDLVSVPPGIEAALAAALGDDLEAPVDLRAARFWGGREAGEPPWPAGVSPLGRLVSGPSQLAARLAFTGLVERDQGSRLQPLLPPGTRIVSIEGDLWRWDGFVCRAEAPRPSQVRLEQKARLAGMLREIEALTPAVEQARALHARAAEDLARAKEAARLARDGPLAADRDVTQARDSVEALEREGARRESRAQSLDETIARFGAERDEAMMAVAAAEAAAAEGPSAADKAPLLADARGTAAKAREAAAAARAALDLAVHERDSRQGRLEALRRERGDWSQRAAAASERQASLAKGRALATQALAAARTTPAAIEGRRATLLDDFAAAEARRTRSSDALSQAEAARAEADRRSRAADAEAADAREARATIVARMVAARERLAELSEAVIEASGVTPPQLGAQLAGTPVLESMTPAAMEERLNAMERERDSLGAVNLRAEEDVVELASRFQTMRAERADLAGALARLRQGLAELSAEGRRRLTAAFEIVDGHFRALFTTLFEGGQAELRLVEAEDPLEAGLEIYACPPGKRMAVMSLMSGGEQALTAVALIFAVFLANPAPVCFLDEVDAPLDDANVDRFCDLLHAMCLRSPTRFVAITHNPLTMSRMDRLFGVTMPRAGVSQLVSVDLRQAEALAAE